MDFDFRELKSYKGYDIQKAWRTDEFGNRIKNRPFFYLVADEEDYIGEEFGSLSKAKRFIDGLPI